MVVVEVMRSVCVLFVHRTGYNATMMVFEVMR